ncbi:MAG: TatD family hydrolase [Proteobacteria bacterium]|nr:TatD family hydrolase [Pseudomonadota bacterium]
MAGEYTTGATGAFDAHSHLDHLDPAALADALEQARSRGIFGWAVSASDPAHWQRVLSVCRRVGALPQLGLHPWWAGELDEEAQDALLAQLTETLTPHGLGETGLDWARAKAPRSRRLQLRAFHAQIEMAQKHGVPLILHGVRAWGTVLDALPTGMAGVLHAFTGSPELADRAVGLGLHISFGPAVLRSERTQRAALRVPADQLLFETDAPDQGPLDSLVDVACFIADLRDDDPHDLLEQSARNARRLFRCPE